MRTARQPLHIPAEFLDQVTCWAQAQPTPVSVILFGSRARGDHGPESDWDFALVYEGEYPSLDELPSEIDDARVEWVPMERSYTLSRLNVCGIPHAAAADGLCLHGAPLPPPERNDINSPNAWTFLFQSYRATYMGISELANYWTIPPPGRWGYDTGVAYQGALAAELLCKAVLSLRGVEPRRSHSVADLCEDLAREHPADPMLPALRELDGRRLPTWASIPTPTTRRRRSACPPGGWPACCPCTEKS